MHRDPILWAEFRDLIGGLLQTDTRLWRATRPEEDDKPPPSTFGE